MKAIKFIRKAGRIIPIKVTAELAGLGLLAAPSIQEIRGKEVSKRKKALMELGGLAVLGGVTASTTFPATAKFIKNLYNLKKVKK